MKGWMARVDGPFVAQSHAASIPAPHLPETAEATIRLCRVQRPGDVSFETGTWFGAVVGTAMFIPNGLVVSV